MACARPSAATSAGAWDGFMSRDVPPDLNNIFQDIGVISVCARWAIEPKGALLDFELILFLWKDHTVSVMTDREVRKLAWKKAEAAIDKAEDHFNVNGYRLTVTRAPLVEARIEFEVEM